MRTRNTLVELKKNERAQINGFSAKLSLDYITRLRELGFREGVLIKCLKTPPLGAPRIFEVCGSVFSVDFDIAREINLDPEN